MRVCMISSVKYYKQSIVLSVIAILENIRNLGQYRFLALPIDSPDVAQDMWIDLTWFQS